LESATPPSRPVSRQSEPYLEGEGWLVFAGILMAMLSILNIVWGIAAIAESDFFVNGARYIFSNLNTWGWIILIIGLVQGFAAYSIWAGGQFGRWVGIGVATLSAIGALMSIPAYPLWSLSIFAVDILVIYGLAAYGGKRLLTN
jgi:hypothetical protein